MPDAQKSTKIIKSQGKQFLTNTGQFFNVERLSIPVILKHSINPYYVQVKERVSGNLFQEYPTYTIWNQQGEKDEKLSMTAMRMCDNLIDADSGMRTNLFMHCQAAWSNGLYDFGGALFEPIWADMPINGVNWKGLYALKQLPSDTFRLLPEGFDKTPAQIMKGVVIGTDGKIHYYQYQDDNKFYEIQNILHIKSPQSRDLAGDALSWPVIPVIEMLNFCLDIRRQKGKRVGAPSLFVEMLSDDEDTLAVATDIITNWDSGTQFAHDENIRVYNLGIGDNGTIEDAIKSLESLLDSLYNPAAVIQKEGTRIGGSDQGAERLIYAQANKFMGWIDLGFSTLLQRWLDINGFEGYTAGVSFPKLEVDKTLLNLQTAKEGYEDKSLTLDERRVLRGHEPADDETKALLAEEYAVSAPEIPVDMTVQNSSIQKKSLNIQNGGPGSGNFGHAGRPGEIGGSGGGGGGGSSSSSQIKQNLKSTMDKDYYSPEEFTKDGYSESQAVSLLHYKEDGYSEIRSALSGKSKMTSDIAEHVKNIDSAIERSELPEGTTLYHGMGEREAAVFKNFSEDQLVGKKFETTGYISSSLNKDVAHVYSEGKAMLVISSKPGGKGVYYKDPDNEDEVVLARGAKYKFDKVTESKGVRYYHVSQVIKK
ncbi:MAG: ADP-ribosyltransferase [Methanothrix sp.]|nr:ADP-ribosyltransferase [Methanothrix sp.]